jgi:hypothetical protein
MYIVDRKPSTVISISASHSRGLCSNLGLETVYQSKGNCWNVTLKQARAATFSSLTHAL